MVTTKTYTFSNVTSDHTIAATFAEDLVTVRTSLPCIVNAVENATTVMSDITVQISTDNSTWETFFTITKSNWSVITPYVASWNYTPNATKQVATGSTVYLRLASAFGIGTVTAVVQGGSSTVLDTTGKAVVTGIDSDKYIYLTIAVGMKTITVTAGDHGDVTLTYDTWTNGQESTNQTVVASNNTVTADVIYGSTPEAVAEADSGYVIDSMTVDGSPVE